MNRRSRARRPKRSDDKLRVTSRARAVLGIRCRTVITRHMFARPRLHTSMVRAWPSGRRAAISACGPPGAARLAGADRRWIDADSECRSVALVSRGGRQQQQVLIDAIGAVERVGCVCLTGIRRLCEHLLRERVVEEQLRGKHFGLVGMDLEVNMDGPPRVPAGVDRGKGGHPACVCHLRAAQPVSGPRC